MGGGLRVFGANPPYELMKADGDPIPSPRNFEQLKRDPDFSDDSADAIVTMVTPRGAMAAAE